MTIKDIANLAKVSTTTVSLILNNKPGSFSEETRTKVLRIAHEGNYVPYAKTMQNSSIHSGLIGLLLPESTGAFSEFIAGAEDAAGAEGYGVILCATQDDGAEIKKHLSSLYSKSVDGVALYISQDMDVDALFVDAPNKLEYAVASNGQTALNRSVAHCSYAEAAEAATSYLLELGHKQIALLGLKYNPFIAEFLSGYGTAVHNHNIVQRDELVYLCENIEGIGDAVKQVTYGKATAFLCVDTRVATCVYRELGRYGLQISKDYSVISIVGEPHCAELFWPTLTAIDLQFRELGKATIQALLYKIIGAAKGEAKEPLRVIPQLRQGGSVAPPFVNSGKRIMVVGSMNMDVIIHTPHIPTSGESLLSQRIINLPGGKGANQAVGIAKLGGNVCLIGCLGGDQEGRLLYSSLNDNGVNIAGVKTIYNKPTGKAYILVAQDGESTIVLSHGTNSELRPTVIKENASRFEEVEYCLISTEIPWETVEYTIDLCIQNNVKIILKPTMQNPIAPEVLKKITYFVPNEKELMGQVGGTLSIEEKANNLFKCGIENVIVTLGDKGCYLCNAETKRYFPAANFVAVDTTGAADAFISAFAVYLSEGHSVISAIKFATYAAGISVTRDGVQPALAGRMALEMYADKYGGHWPG